MTVPFGKYFYLCLALAASCRLQAAGYEHLVTRCEFSPQECLQLEACSLRQSIHPIHISVTEITYSEKDKALQITSRLFIDDLELSIRSQRKEAELDILEPKNGLTTQQ
ncbi:MAG: DUF6702 family protein, partial [Cyclobacteriaceae bacterium]